MSNKRRASSFRHVFFVCLFGVFAIFGCIFQQIQAMAASVPLSMALVLEGDGMAEGDSMKVTVALQNYDENYNENAITTMIVEVSFDTSRLKVDKDNIQVEFDEGSGMGFVVAHVKNECNVELQYLNVADPLKKGTKDLYTFQITALEDVPDLLKAINITYIAVQDGRFAQSVPLTTVPCVLVNGEVREQESANENYTSEYGVNTNTSSSHGSGGENGNTDHENKSTDSSENETDRISEKNTQTEEENTVSQNTNSQGEEGGSSSNGNDSENLSSGEKETVNQDNRESGEKEEKTISDNKNNVKKDDKADKAGKKEKNNRTVIAVAVIIVIIAAVGVFLYLYKGKKKEKDDGKMEGSRKEEGEEP